MDGIVDVPRYPVPPNILPSTRNSVEKLLYITQRFNEKNYRGFQATCMFYGFSRKGNTSQFRIHFTKESEGGTTCSPCSKVPPVITEYYIEQRDAVLAKKSAKQTAAATALHKAIIDDDDSYPSSQDSKRSRHSCGRDASQPSIRHALVSFIGTSIQCDFI